MQHYERISVLLQAIMTQLVCRTFVAIEIKYRISLNRSRTLINSRP